MPPSYEKINYRIRPAKNVQRKMLVECVRRLTEFGGLETYQYVGFGSTYFSDFSLFHKALGINRMISIEKDIKNQGRFRFNRPFSCIKLAFGESNAVLPTLSWRSKAVLWLDYDSKLNSSVLTDIGHFCTYAVSGSIVIVTVEAKPDEEPEERVKRLRKAVGKLKVPTDITFTGLADWGTAAACRRIINNEIMERLSYRNGGVEESKQLLYKQLFNFRYSDGTKMVTVGGIIYEKGKEGIFQRCAFGKNLPFVCGGEEAFLIEAPNLTFKELHYLDSKLPTRVPPGGHSIPEEDVGRYARIYRYFPRFAEAEF